VSKFQSILEEEYDWIVTHSKIGHVCYSKTWTVQELTDTIFGCKKELLECRVFNTLFVWYENLFNFCPFKTIGFESFTEIRIDNERYFRGEHKFKLFKLKKYTSECESPIIETEEGLFLSGKQLGPFINESKDITLIHKLMLSEEDSLSFDLLEKQLKSNVRVCDQIYNLLSLATHFHDYYRLRDALAGIDLMTFISENVIFVPRCKKFNSFKLRETKNCFKDLPISVNGNVGFINRQNIFKSESEHINCSSRSVRILHNESNTMMRIEQNKMIQWHLLNKVKINWFDELQKLNINHYEIQISERKLKLDENIPNSGSTSDVNDEVVNNVNEEVGEMSVNLKGAVNKISKSIKNVVMFILSFLCVAAVIVIISCIRTVRARNNEPLISIKLSDLIEHDKI